MQKRSRGTTVFRKWTKAQPLFKGKHSTWLLRLRMEGRKYRVEGQIQYKHNLICSSLTPPCVVFSRRTLTCCVLCDLSCRGRPAWPHVRSTRGSVVTALGIPSVLCRAASSSISFPRRLCNAEGQNRNFDAKKKIMARG
ncbi:hypothetical protein DIPPA_70196 [Diplonema papillatum]|nr:hypothetical protein DIPPA_70196 [Diplonema papillatum]